MKTVKDKSQLILTLVSGMLLVANLLLVFQNLDLRSKLQRFEPVEVKEGDVFQTFQAKDVNGRETEINYDGDDSKKVLLFFRTTCGYCQKQLPYWKALVKNADGREYKFTAITIEDETETVKNYLKENKIENWNVLSINSDEAQNAKLLSTPITVVVNNKGVVEKAWTGMWQDKDFAAAGNYFAVDFAKVKTDGN